MQIDLSQRPISTTALALAKEHHKGVYRKYSGRPYINHPIEVATTLLKHGHYDDPVIAAAFLHDCLEDENVEGERMERAWIAYNCGERTARYVQWLSDLETGNREQRKQKSLARLMQAPAAIKDVKLADIMCNIKDIVEQDPSFAPQYLREKRAIIDAFRGMATFNIWDAAAGLLERCEDKAAHLIIGQAKREHEEERADIAAINDILTAQDNAYLRELAMF